ncbi:kelch repeat-containing protein [Tahibacter soli]|uniref:Kelch repeat-containing protein n=1 Tax=Tahibacter soli TaxID=2983605 RepID=A0A9X3YRH3_9GAMM|nr:kelch repeat-containing protein [Tahibacter soli]MDC8016240.1 kelch repeat-containing protein [Tahibacter soli]
MSVLLAILAAGNAFASGFLPAATPAAARTGHTTTLLPTGKVLVAGGTGAGGAVLGSTELYDAVTNTWSAGPAMPAARANHTATRLRSGKVLVVGGFDGTAIVGTALLYDPVANAWSAAAAPSGARANHTATLLSSGKVLVVGGNNESVLNTAEIYDPASDSWTAARPLAVARTNHTATLMPSGRVLVVGGFRIGALDSAVLYDPPTDTWIGALTLATPRSAHTATLMPNGKVLVAGGLNGSNAIASAEIFDATTGWSAAAPMGAARQAHAATVLSTGEVLVVGGAAGNAAGSARLGAAERYDPATNRWTHADNLVVARSQATLTSLPNGQLLLAGGADASGPLASAELYDRTTPYYATWIPGGTLAAGRMNHTTTALPSGKALVVGGGLASDGNSALTSVELYDPAANAFTAAAPLAVARRYHSATLMPSGKVLVVGGYNGTNMLNTAVLYDPANNTWSGAGTMGKSRSLHTATLLASGKVLIVGGTEDGGGMPNTAEVYDPATNGWTPAGTITTVRFHHVAGLLGSGKVLIAGGDNGPSAFDSVEIYDPATNAWSPGPRTSSARQEAVGMMLPSGRFLVIGGVNAAGTVLSSAEQYDPTTNSWSDVAWMSTQRRWHTAALLPSGKVLVAGGVDAYFNYNIHDWAELYDPALNLWTTVGTFGTPRYGHTLTTLLSGRAIIVGGTDGTTSHAVAMLYQPQSTTLSNAAAAPSARGGHTATMLSTGRLLLAGGADVSGPIGTAQRYDASTDAWSAAAGFTTARRAHTATTLPDGRVLAIGGLGSAGVLASVERYDPPGNAWSAASPLATARRAHTATLLANGQVLVAGGFGSAALNGAERYDPATNAWTGAGTMTTARYQHAATLLPSGKVLVSGGSDASGALNSAELYDPATGSWTPAGTFSQTRELHTSTLLPSGKVLLIGGRSGTSPRGALVVYDPAANTWTRLDSGLFTLTFSHTATLLPSGRVLIAGGDRGDGGGQRRVAIFDPVTEVLTAFLPLAVPRYGHTATLLPTGKVLIAGGFNAGGAVTSTELYDPDLAPVAARRPDVASAGSFATPTTALTANALGTTYSGGAVQTTGFASPVDGSSGNGTASSATGSPVIQVQRLDNEQQRYVDGGATDTLFTGRAAALAGFAAGPVLVRAWVNGVPGAATYTTIAATAGQPTSVSATAGTMQATVTFAASTNANGGAPITGYVATATGGATAACTAPCTSIVFDPLPGGAYTFTVAAVNAAGTGTPSAASNGIVVRAAPTLSLSSGTNPATVGDDVTFTATLTQAFAPTGNVQFCANSTITTSGCIGGTVLCTVPANASPIACTSAALPAGTHAVAAWYPGDANNAFAVTQSLSQVVDKRLPSLGWAEPAPITYGTALGAAQLNATATWNGNPVAGTFTYFPPAGTMLDAGAGQLLSATFVPADTATYATSGAVMTTTLIVNAVSTTVAIGSVAGARVGVALSVPYTVSGAAGAPAVPGGSGVVVTATPGGATCTASVAAGQCAITFATAGNYALTAQYEGSANFLPSATGAATAVTVGTNTTATTLSAAPNPSVLGQPVTASVSVADTTGGPVPTGSVNVNADSGESCTATLANGAGQCTLTLTHLGPRTLTASYAGDAANAVSAGTATQSVNRATVAVTIDDHHGYTRYDAVPSYVVTLANASPVTTHPVLSASSPGTGINLAGAQWFCTSNGGGSGCVDGTGVFAANATLPANASMTWTLLVPLVPASNDPTIELRIDVAGDVNPASASDVNTLVIFRDGLQVPGDTQ